MVKSSIPSIFLDDALVLTSKPKPVLRAGGGKVVLQDKMIKFDRVPLVTPNGDVLVEEMSFEVRADCSVG